jgi:hypothetical protein
MVTDISEAEIVCLLFDENFGIISEVTHREQFVSSTNSAVMDQRRTMKNPSGPLHPFWWDCVTRITSLFLLCPITTGIGPCPGPRLKKKEKGLATNRGYSSGETEVCNTL